MNGKKKIQVTQKGLEALKKELQDLREEKRPKIVERLAHARSQGDLSENSDYQNARDELEFLEGQVEELELVIRNAQVVSGDKNGRVSLGTKVSVKYDGSESVFEIVGEWEADLAKKKISHISPLGQALVGKRVGDKVEVEAPAGKITYQILKIE